MAESLGSAVLSISVDDSRLKAGLQAAERQARSTGQAVGQAFTASNKPILTAANGLQYFVDAQGKARDLSGKFLTLAQQQAAGIDRIGGSAQRAGDGINELLGALAGLGLGATAAGFVRGSINAAVELESITKKLSNTLGPQGAGLALSFTKGLSDQLGLSFKTLANSFGSFTAAATAANVPLAQQKELFAAVSKAAQSLGLSNDEINGSLLALQQVAAKGTVQMEELRGQLGERLPIAFGATARGLGITQQELIKLVETGRLTAGEFFPALTKGLNELTSEAGGASTAAQNFQKLGNAWDDLQTSFGNSLLPVVVDQVNNLSGALDGLKIGIDANKLGLGGLFGNLGLVPDAGIEAVAAVRKLADEFSLSSEQARALFFDAAKLEGLRLTSTGFLPDAKGLERTLNRLPKLAEEFRSKNKDSLAELRAQAAEAARIAAEQKKSIAAKQKELDSGLAKDIGRIELGTINERTKTAKVLALAEGTVLAQTTARLAIEEKVKAAKIAQLQLQRELAKPAGDGKDGTRSSQRVDELLIAQQKANAEVRQAYAEAGASLVKNAKTAADALKSARDSYNSLVRSNLDFLTPGFARSQIAQARAAIQPLVDRGVIRQGLDISSPERLFELANFAESFTKAERDLGQAIDENTRAQKELLNKDWKVTVNVPGGSASGDVVGAVNSRL